MLVSFEIENWGPFSNLETVSFIAGRERQHRQTLSSVPRYKMSILPIVSFFGEAGTGKTALIEALSFLRAVGVGDSLSQSTTFDFFRMTYGRYANDPSRIISIAAMVLVGDDLLEYRIHLSHRGLERELITQVGVTSDKVLVEATLSSLSTDGSKSQRRSLSPYLGSYSFVADGPILAYLGKRATEVASDLASKKGRKREVDEKEAMNFDYLMVRRLYDWFSESVEIFGLGDSNSGLISIRDFSTQMLSDLSRALNRYEMDIDLISIDETVFDKELLVPYSSVLKDGSEQVDLLAGLLGHSSGWLVSRGETWVLRRLMARSARDGRSRALSLYSPGEQRAVALVASVFFSHKDNISRLIAYDDADLRVFPSLMRKILLDFIEAAPRDPSIQLMVTLGSPLLLDQDIFRRDEMVIVEASGGQHNLASISDFSGIRYDRDIMRLYLDGLLSSAPTEESGG